MANVEARVTVDGYPRADDVMRGGILLACHHGLNEAQIDHIHDCVGAFVGQLPTTRTEHPRDLRLTIKG
jgi:CDP-4-dehydro-6-deoxyglucose reductase, E1